MNVTLRQMRAFVEVVRAGGFTAASRRLHLTQSATSLLVRELEGQLGLQLLDRSSRKLSLTEAGSEFLRSSERILVDVDEAVLQAQDLLEMRRGRVTVAAPPVLAATLLPEVIARFETQHPAIAVRLVDEPVDKIVQSVQRGEADFGVGVFPSEDNALDRVPLMEHALGAMVPSAWPLARRRRELCWADLADQQMIVMSDATGFPKLIAPMLFDAGVAIKPRFEVHYLWSAIGLAEAGLGIAIVPAYAGLLAPSPRVKFRTLHEPLVQRRIELITHPGRSLSPSARAFRDCLATRCRELAG